MKHLPLCLICSVPCILVHFYVTTPTFQNTAPSISCTKNILIIVGVIAHESLMRVLRSWRLFTFFAYTLDLINPQAKASKYVRSGECEAHSRCVALPINLSEKTSFNYHIYLNIIHHHIFNQDRL